MSVMGLGGYFACGLNAQAIYDNYQSAMNFTVGNSYQVCEQPLNNRCVTHFMVEKPDGSIGDFVPAAFQFEPDVLHAELRVKKSAKSFSYELDGVEQQWPYLWRCVGVALIGLLGVIGCLVFLIRRFFASSSARDSM